MREVDEPRTPSATGLSSARPPHRLLVDSGGRIGTGGRASPRPVLSVPQLSDDMAPELSLGKGDDFTARLGRLEALLDAIPAPLAVLDVASSRLVLTNRRFVELTGVDAAICGTRSFRQAFPSTDIDVPEAVAEASQGQIQRALRVTVRTGPRMRVLEAVFRALGDERPAREVVFAAVDVTEREQLREDLAHLVGQLTSIFGVIPDAVRVFDVHGNVVRANAQAMRDCELGSSSTLQDRSSCSWKGSAPFPWTSSATPPRVRYAASVCGPRCCGSSAGRPRLG